MDVDKVNILRKSLNLERQNIELSISTLKLRISEFELALNNNSSNSNFIDMIYDEIVRAKLTGDKMILIQSTVTANKYRTVKDIHSHMYQLLLNCGIKNIKIESRNEYILRTKDSFMTGNTIISADL